MEFKFDANQEYQTAAIEAVANLLEGQHRIELDFNLILQWGSATVMNRLDLDESALLANLQTVQQKNGILPDERLQCIEETIETARSRRQVSFANFSVEMETGTGKTYVYLRTALELFKRYGLRKFIVVVPSVAVREGVLKTLKITERHLKEIYSNPSYRYYIYDSANLSQVRQFALSDGIEIMVMTIDAFNKAANVIRQSTDKLMGETPLHLVQSARPILILDEPQNMESEKSIAALASLNPLFILRYSATHRNPYNLVYRLTPFDAYRQGLVKRIEVASVVKENDFNQVFLRLDSISSKKNTITAKIAVHQLQKTGTIKEKVITVKPGNSLAEKTNRPEYAGFDIEEINPGSQTVLFTNNLEISIGESQGADKEAIFASQIRYTVEEHFRKQRRFKNQGIKVISLFFIDRVANYQTENGESGIIRNLFNQAFEELKLNYPDWQNYHPTQVQAAYFAQKKKGGEIIFEDSTTGAAKKDEEAYNLIMKDKERLLSLDEPVAFIFSHSALREGWDNPNVFQICTLNQTTSEAKKRQEIGRGVRLAVNQQGSRLRDEKVNILTVVANESYEKYVATLQQEIENEYGKEGLPPKPANARERGIAKLRKQYLLKPEFQQLWEKIKHKTRYAVQINTEKLIDEVINELEEKTITPPRVTITKARVEVGNEDVIAAMQITSTKTVMSQERKKYLPNLISIFVNLLLNTSPPVSLSRRTLLRIFQNFTRKEEAIANPYEFATITVQIIKNKLADHLVNGIQYQKIDDWYEMTQFQDEIETWKEYLIPANRSVYDHVVIDSQAEDIHTSIEGRFVADLEKRDDVKLFVKLPNWFTVPTPVGEYNPDWAIVMEDRDEHGEALGTLLYLVRETKSTTNLDQLRPDERRKILCGQKHFNEALGGNYCLVTSTGELP
ncbi:MAG: DEAD/DEAH box helicase family protein [Crinalium sp.]